MTDERGGRYFREARFFLAGDKVAAQSHILEARSLMGYMRDMQALGGPPIQAQYATLKDGTRIKATMMNGQYQAEIVSPAPLRHTEITACAIHMDSGIVDVVSLAPLSSDWYANAKLYVGTALADNRFWGDVSVPSGIGHTTMPVGGIGAAVIESPPNVTGQEVECLQYVEPDRPDGVSDEAWEDTVEQKRLGLLGKKFRVAYSFSSYFSGKTRLYVQAVNARKLFDEARPSPEFSLFGISPPSLDIPMYEADGSQAMMPTADSNAVGRVKTLRIENSSLVSTGIYTDSNNHYWYVQLTNVGGYVAVTITQMLLSPCGYVAAEQAKNSLADEERTQFEALALSTGTPYNPVSFTIEDVCEIPDETGPICYGWTFKWDGSEAHIVVHNRTASVSFVAYHLQVDISRDGDMVTPSGSTTTPAEQERARWTVTGRLVEGGNSWRSKSGLQNLWVPSFGSGGLFEWANTPDAVDCHGDAPLYCFYDRQDTLQILRYTGVNHGAHVDTQYPPCYEAAYGWASGVAGSFVAQQQTYTRDQSASFTCGPVSVSGRVALATELYNEMAITGGGYDASPGYTHACNTTAPVGSPCASNAANLEYKAIIEAPLPPGEPGWVAKYEMGISTYTRDIGQLNPGVYISAVIPWGDCAAVYLARKGGDVRLGDRTVYWNNTYVLSEEAGRFMWVDDVKIQLPGYAKYVWRNIDQIASPTITTSTYYENDEVEEYRFIGFDGVGRTTEVGDWTGNLMSPSLLSLEDAHTFSTFSSAGQADIIGTGFTTGGYALDDRGSMYAPMYNRAFIGFA